MPVNVKNIWSDKEVDPMNIQEHWTRDRKKKKKIKRETDLGTCITQTRGTSPDGVTAPLCPHHCQDFPHFPSPAMS